MLNYAQVKMMSLWYVHEEKKILNDRSYKQKVSLINLNRHIVKCDADPIHYSVSM